MVLINSIARAIAILNQFRPAANETLSLGEIADLAKLHKTTAHGIVSNLVRSNFLVQDRTTRRYSLGPALFELGSLYRARINAYPVSLPYMRELSATVGKTVQLAMLAGTDVIYISRVITKEFMSFSVADGVRNYAHCTSTGKSMLAQLTDAQIDELFPRPDLPPRTPYSVKTVQALKAELAKIRDRGYAIDYQEVDEGLCGVAMPLNTSPQMAVGVSFTVDAADSGEQESYVPHLRAACRKISDLLGGA